MVECDVYRPYGNCIADVLARALGFMKLAIHIDHRGAQIGNACKVITALGSAELYLSEGHIGIGEACITPRYLPVGSRTVRLSSGFTTAVQTRHTKFSLNKLATSQVFLNGKEQL